MFEAEVRAHGGAKEPLEHVGSCVYLSQVKLEDVADVMWRTLGQLHQLLAILEGLTQLLHARLHSVHPVDALRGGSRML